MTKNTRIYNRFTGYIPEDCACEWCLHHGGKERPCLVAVWRGALGGDKAPTRG